MKTITFTNDEIEMLKGMLGSYISYMRASGGQMKIIVKFVHVNHL